MSVVHKLTTKHWTLSRWINPATRRKARCRSLSTAMLVALACVGLMAPDANAEVYSDTCTGSSAETVFDGWWLYPVFGATPQYTRLIVDPRADGEIWVCFQLRETGGRLRIASEDATFGQDGEADACANTAGNQAPGPHPLVEGGLHFPDEVPLLFDTYVSEQSVWICLRAGPVDRRVVISTGDLSLPLVEKDDAATPPPAFESAPPWWHDNHCWAGYWSNIVNADVGENHIWILTSLSDFSRKRHLCIRVETPDGGVGGVLTVREPWFGLGGPLSCATPVASFTSPAKLSVGFTATSDETYFCISALDTVALYPATPGVSADMAEWTPDPST